MIYGLRLNVGIESLLHAEVFGFLGFAFSCWRQRMASGALAGLLAEQLVDQRPLLELLMPLTSKLEQLALN